jgi:hypothetical protein
VIDLVECKVGAFARAFCQYLLALPSRAVYVTHLVECSHVLPGEEVEGLPMLIRDLLEPEEIQLSA